MKQSLSILILFNASFFLFTYLLNDHVSSASYILALGQVGRHSTFPEGPTDPSFGMAPSRPCPSVHALYMSDFWTVACQAPLSMGFSIRYWSGLPFLFPGDLPDSGIVPTSPASPALADGFFTTVPPWKPCPNRRQ